MCAIFGITGSADAVHSVYLGLNALQHRGQESCGIVSTDGDKHYSSRKQGLIREAFTEEDTNSLQGKSAIGHTRYSTTGASIAANIQPFVMRTRFGTLALAHNGNLTNAPEMIKSLEKQGSIFQSTSDTEVIAHLIAKPSNDELLPSITKALSLLEGSFSLLILANKTLFAIRDPHGFRPLVMGIKDEALVFSSETCAFDLIGASYVREVQPGEVVVANTSGQYKSHYPFREQPLRRCVFEHIYFARPDSIVFDASVHDVRKALGKQLAKEQPCEGDVVIPVPDSGVPAAIGYAEQSKIPFDMGIIRNHYSQRTFINPKQSIRDLAVKLKLNPVRSIQGKRVIVIDDSLVRGTTSKKIVRMLREVGAKEVHLRISAPPTKHPCVYGIDTPTYEELIASHVSIDKIREMLGADSLGYLSLEGLEEVVSGFSGKGFCNACFSGDYPAGR